MVRKLSDAVNVVMQPLSKKSLDRHSGEVYFDHKLDDILLQGSLTRAQAEEQGYIVVEVLEHAVGTDAAGEKEAKEKKEE